MGFYQCSFKTRKKAWRWNKEIYSLLLVSLARDSFVGWEGRLFGRKPSLGLRITRKGYNLLWRPLPESWSKITTCARNQDLIMINPDQDFLSVNKLGFESPNPEKSLSQRNSLIAPTWSGTRERCRKFSEASWRAVLRLGYSFRENFKEMLLLWFLDVH